MKNSTISTGSLLRNRVRLAINAAIALVGMAIALFSAMPALAGTFAAFTYPMDQSPVLGTGAITDSTGNSSGTIVEGGSGLPALVAGKFGNAWDFSNPNNGYIQVGENAVTDLIGDTAHTSGLSISCWVKITAANATANTRLASSLGTFDLWENASGSTASLNFRFGNGTTVPTFSLQATNIFDGNWHHVCASIDFTHTSNNYTLYVDGVAKSTLSVTLTTPFNTTGSGYLIGNYAANQGFGWNGAIDDWNVFLQPLTATQVQTLYTQGSNSFVSSTPPVPISQGQTLALSGYVVDDGLPNPPADVTTTWAQLSGSGTATFADGTAPSSDVTFSAPGIYDLELTSNDGARTTTSDILATVTANQPPVVSAYGSQKAIILPTNSISLTGTATDDGLPHTPGALTTTWSTHIGPASATFGNANSLSTTATFTTPGRYVLRLSASDGQYTRIADVPVRVYASTVGFPADDIVVDAGSCRSVWLNSPSTSLHGTYVNSTGTPTVAWTMAQGPGTVTFSNPSSQNTTATFSASGQYILQMAVSDTNGGYGIGRAFIAVYPTTTNFGYTSTDLQNDFTQDLNIEYDFNNFNWGGFSAPPAPYVHPRIQFGPADLPRIRTALTNTTTGSYFMGRIRSQVTELTQSGGKYYSIYTDLVNGSTTSLYALGLGSNAYDEATADVTYEAFRCLIDDDTVGGAKDAAAFTTMMTGAYSEIEAVMPTTDYQNKIKVPVYYNFSGYAYDFLYNFMTNTQQMTCRQTLSLATTGMWAIGMDTLPGGRANESNWIPTHNMHLLIDSLAIEGETGWDPNLYPRIVEAYQRFLTLGVNKDGTAYEGLAKNQLCVEALSAMARHGDYLLASLGSKEQIDNYYTYAMVPWGEDFMWDEDLGGPGEARYADVAIAKYAFPSDPVTDFVFRNDETESLSTRFSDFQRRFWPSAMDFLHRAVFAEDYNTPQTWDQERQSAVGSLPLTMYSAPQGLMIARSDWTTNATQLFMQPRSVQGGHSHHDRNQIIFSALGFNWVPYMGWAGGSEQFASVDLIDNVGASVYPALPVEWDTNADYDFLAGDAAMSFNWGPMSSPNPSALTWDEVHSDPLDTTWSNLTFAYAPEWQTSQKTNETWGPYNPVLYAYRTAGVVRGGNPYAIVVDDIQKDNSNHNYTFNLQIAPTVTVSISGTDVTLTDPSSTRRLLVRLLQCNGTPTISSITMVPPSGQGTDPAPMLQITTNTVSPAFKVMLYAYTQGSALPTTSWSGNVLSVSTTPGQTDQLTMTVGTDHRTRIAFSR